MTLLTRLARSRYSTAEVQRWTALVVEVRAEIAAWTTEPLLSRVLVAQLRHVEQLIEGGDYDDATVALGLFLAGYQIARPPSGMTNGPEAVAAVVGR